MRRYANRRIGRGFDVSAAGRGRAGPVAFAGEDRRTVEPRTRYRHGRRADHALGHQAGPSGSDRIIGRRPRIRPAGGPVPTAMSPRRPGRCATSAGRRHPGEGSYGQNAVSPWAACGSRPRQPGRTFGERPDHRQAAPYPPGRRSGPDRDGPPAPRTLRDLTRTAASRRGIVRAERGTAMGGVRITPPATKPDRRGATGSSAGGPVSARPEVRSRPR